MAEMEEAAVVAAAAPVEVERLRAIARVAELDAAALVPAAALLTAAALLPLVLPPLLELPLEHDVSVPAWIGTLSL